MAPWAAEALAAVGAAVMRAGVVVHPTLGPPIYRRKQQKASPEAGFGALPAALDPYQLSREGGGPPHGGPQTAPKGQGQADGSGRPNRHRLPPPDRHRQSAGGPVGCRQPVSRPYRSCNQGHCRPTRERPRPLREIGTPLQEGPPEATGGPQGQPGGPTDHSLPGGPPDAPEKSGRGQPRRCLPSISRNTYDTLLGGTLRGGMPEAWHPLRGRPATVTPPLRWG